MAQNSPEYIMEQVCLVNSNEFILTYMVDQMY